MNKKVLLASIALLILVFSFPKIKEKIPFFRRNTIQYHEPNPYRIREVEQYVEIKSNPELIYSYDTLRSGVIQHLDRIYTYDYIPTEMDGAILYQGLHRLPEGTSFSIVVKKPATIYTFFHDSLDGGYGPVFQKLNDWSRVEDSPKYDVNHGEHGLHMTTYKREVKKGIYNIPATTKNNACFSIAIQF